MKDSLSKIFGVAEKIKTPLALSGLALIILYLIFDKILSLDLFTKINSSNTFLLLQGILDKLFWLAIFAIVLGVGSHILGVILKHKIESRSSNVGLLDARLDPHDSNYEEIQKDGKVKIQRKKKQ